MLAAVYARKFIIALKRAGLMLRSNAQVRVALKRASLILMLRSNAQVYNHAPISGLWLQYR